MEAKKKQGIYLILAGAVVLVGVLVFVFGMPGTAPGDTPTATSTEPVATTTNIFDMEPIVPEAKVSTEGWKTCRNEEYGYEFKFPAEWKIYGEDALSNPDPSGKRYFVRESEECNGSQTVVTLDDVTKGYGTNPTQPGISVVVRDTSVGAKENANGIMIKPENMQELAEVFARSAENQITSYSIDGARSFLRVFQYPRDRIPYEVWNIDVFVGTLRYEIKLHGRSNDSIRDTLETTLSTFRFIDTPRTNDTSATE